MENLNCKDLFKEIKSNASSLDNLSIHYISLISIEFGQKNIEKPKENSMF